MFYRGYWRFFSEGRWIKCKSEEEYLLRSGQSPDIDSTEGSDAEEPPTEEECPS